MFLESNNILSPNQHGFRENCSTMSALLSFLNYIYKNIDEGKKATAVFVDLSKAFDCVDHDILLKKVECYGLRGQCNKILQSYLLNRKQFVQYYDKRSQEMEVNVGVPRAVYWVRFYSCYILMISKTIFLLFIVLLLMICLLFHAIEISMQWLNICRIIFFLFLNILMQTTWQ